jgi:hypothetical protein
MDFAISYNRMMRVLAAPLGMGPGSSGARVADGTVRVWMGRFFDAEFDVAQVARAEPLDRLGWWWGQGVHSFRGTSVVNGSNQGLVRLELDPPARGRAPFRAEVQVLIVSLEDPAGFLAAIGR